MGIGPIPKTSPQRPNPRFYCYQTQIKILFIEYMNLKRYLFTLMEYLETILPQNVSNNNRVNNPGRGGNNVNNINEINDIDMMGFNVEGV